MTADGITIPSPDKQDVLNPSSQPIQIANYRCRTLAGYALTWQAGGLTSLNSQRVELGCRHTLPRLKRYRLDGDPDRPAGTVCPIWTNHAVVHTQVLRGKDGGPARTRTWDQGIHLIPLFPARADYLITHTCFPGNRCQGAGRSSLLLRALGEHTSPQVVSAPSGSALPAWLRIAIGLPEYEDRKVSLNSSRSFHASRRERTILMSPLL